MPVGVTPRLCDWITAPLWYGPPTYKQHVVGDALIVVGAGVMLYGFVAELALKLLSPAYCALTELFPPGNCTT